MNVIVAGLDFHTPVAIREKAAYTTEKLAKAYRYLMSHAAVGGCVILSTCNRSEVYAAVEDSRAGQEVLTLFFEENHQIERVYLYQYEDKEALAHLFLSASGLKSLVLGEDQILGQIREAHRRAMEEGCAGDVLNRVFFAAITSGKALKAEGISGNSLSVSSVGVRFLQQALGSLQGRKALIIGAGETGRLTAKKLQGYGMESIAITNRTRKTAQLFSGEIKGSTVVDYSDRYRVMESCDIVISCTSSPHFTVKKEFVKNKSLMALDLAVPRDIEPSVAELPGVRLYTIDDLQSVTADNLSQRREKAKAAEGRILQHALETEEWLRRYPLLNGIRAANEYGKKIVDQQVAYALRKLDLQDDSKKKKLEKILRHTVNAALHPVLEAVDEQSFSDKLYAIFHEGDTYA